MGHLILDEANGSSGLGQWVFRLYFVTDAPLNKIDMGILRCL